MGNGSVVRRFAAAIVLCTVAVPGLPALAGAKAKPQTHQAKSWVRVVGKPVAVGTNAAQVTVELSHSSRATLGAFTPKGKRVKLVARQLKAGKRTLTIKGLKPGKYRLRVATGSKAKSQQVRLNAGVVRIARPTKPAPQVAAKPALKPVPLTPAQDAALKAKVAREINEANQRQQAETARAAEEARRRAEEARNVVAPAVLQAQDNLSAALARLIAEKDTFSNVADQVQFSLGLIIEAKEDGGQVVGREERGLAAVASRFLKFRWNQAGSNYGAEVRFELGGFPNSVAQPFTGANLQYYFNRITTAINDLDRAIYGRPTLSAALMDSWVDLEDARDEFEQAEQALATAQRSA